MGKWRRSIGVRIQNSGVRIFWILDSEFCILSNSPLFPPFLILHYLNACENSLSQDDEKELWYFSAKINGERL